MYSGRVSSAELRSPRYLNVGLLCPNLGLIYLNLVQTAHGLLGGALEAKKLCKTRCFTMFVAMPKEPPRAPREFTRSRTERSLQEAPRRASGASQRTQKRPKGAPRSPPRGLQGIPCCRSGGSPQGKFRQTAGTPDHLVAKACANLRPRKFCMWISTATDSRSISREVPIT